MNSDTGLGGGVLALPTFQSEFGLIDDKGVAVPNLSALQGNIVSVLQGGAFFGAIFVSIQRMCQDVEEVGEVESA